MVAQIKDIKTRNSVNRFFDKLEKYYPEHKVFAMDSIDKGIRENLSELYKKAGYDTVEEFLAAYGFKIISGDEVRKIRSFVLYTPGNEPDVIKSKVDNMLRRLHEYYPDGKVQSLQKEHKSLSNSVSGLYQWLGYENARQMLSAYGFDMQQVSEGGRPQTNDYENLISILQKKYSGENKIKSLGVLIYENPEYAGQIKSLQNKSNELFGMSLAKYFKKIGIMASAESTTSTNSPKKSGYHYLCVSAEDTDEQLFCATLTRSVHEGEYVEMRASNDDITRIALVTETHYYTEENDLPCPLKEMNQFIRKVTKTEIKDIEDSKNKYIFCTVRIPSKHYGEDFIEYYVSPFNDIEAGDIVVVKQQWYGLVDAIVTEVQRVSAKTAPKPIKNTKEIQEIKYSTAKERAKSKAAIDRLISANSVKNFNPNDIESEIVKLYSTCTYFASAVFRGFEMDVYSALRRMYPGVVDISVYVKQVCDGIAQFECSSALVPKIIKEFPGLKCVFFAEHWKTQNVYLAFSESGYDTVTGYRLLGTCNFYARDRWSLIHDPTEKTFVFSGGKYEFAEISQWEKCNFVLPDGKTKLGGETSIPSVPYKKKKSTDPYQIITIQYPED